MSTTRRDFVAAAPAVFAAGLNEPRPAPEGNYVRADDVLAALERLGLIPADADDVTLESKVGAAVTIKWTGSPLPARDVRAFAHAPRRCLELLVEGGIIPYNCCEATLYLKRGAAAKITATCYVVLSDERLEQIRRAFA